MLQHTTMTTFTTDNINNLYGKSDNFVSTIAGKQEICQLHLEVKAVPKSNRKIVETKVDTHNTHINDES